MNDHNRERIGGGQLRVGRVRRWRAVGGRLRACAPPAEAIRNQAVRGHGGIWWLIRRALLGLTLATCALALVTTAACSSMSPEEDTAFMARSDAAMAQMMTAMQSTPSGDVDRDFVAMMVPHHQGAVAMAQAELRYGHNSRLRSLAQEIIVTQHEEIAEMQLALTSAAASSSSGAEDAAFAGRCDAAMAQMMTAMRIKPANDVDRDFVAMMVPHHQGAIDMADAELSYGRSEPLRGLAQEIIATQAEQIAVMRRALDEPFTPTVPSLNQSSSSSMFLLSSLPYPWTLLHNAYVAGGHVSTTPLLKRGTCTCQDQAVPSGVLTMPVLRFPHMPTGFASGGWLTTPSGAAQPVNAPETPTISPASRPLPLALTSVGRAARSFLRDSALFCHKRPETERSGVIPPYACRQGSLDPN